MNNDDDVKKFEYEIASIGISHLIFIITFLVIGFNASSQILGITLGSTPLIITIILSTYIYINRNSDLMILLAMGGIYVIPVLLILFISSSITMSFIY